MNIARAVGLRLISALPLAIGCTVLLFILQAVASTDPARTILGIGASAEAVAELREKLGLDQPIVLQYLDFVSNALRGDLGTSYYDTTTVTDVVTTRLPVTLSLMGLSLLVAFIISITLALLGASRPDGVWDQIGRALTLGATVLPAFWVGILLIMFVALPTGWFPAGGLGNGPGDFLRGLVLPSITLGLSLIPIQLRTLRSALVKNLDSVYVEGARSRGARLSRQVGVHALPNSISPFISIVAVQAGWLIFLSVVVENTFRLPGLGSAIVDAATRNDYPIINGITLVLALLIIGIGVISDILLIAVNPLLRGRS